MSKAVVALRSTRASAAVASIGAHLAGLLPSHSAVPSSGAGEEDSGGAPQPPPSPRAPFSLPAGGNSSSLSGGQIGASGGVGPLLLLGALAWGLVLPRRNGKLLKAFCEVPRLCSALLVPLERPG